MEGGPIIDPGRLLRVCDTSRADGYVGGSTLVRLPLEMSVMQPTSAFKVAGLLREEAPECGRIPGLVGRSQAARQLAAACRPAVPARRPRRPVPGLEGDEGDPPQRRQRPRPDVFGGGTAAAAGSIGHTAAIGQILVLDLVFKADSIITSV
ncbi:hypothetical protein [Falsiroseomonas sp. E2-1-a4]|uniref:hypothetical protein n=1 Tax=Falsiroseomonas sp. E2-1-a4 TaxID=3239299 RepID=UPI003F3E2177